MAKAKKTEIAIIKNTNTEFDFSKYVFNGQNWELKENKIEFDFENHVFDGQNWIKK